MPKTHVNRAHTLLHPSNTPHFPALRPHKFMNDFKTGLKRSDIEKTQVITRDFSPKLVKRPHIGVMLSDAYSAAAEEFRKLRDKSATEEGLDLNEVKKLTMLGTMLTALAKEEREQVKQDRLEEIGDAELILQAEEALRSIKSST